MCAGEEADATLLSSFPFSFSWDFFSHSRLNQNVTAINQMITFVVTTMQHHCYHYCHYIGPLVSQSKLREVVDL